MASSGPPGEVPGVNISGSQGAQVGTGNVQINALAQKQPPDPVSLSALNPHTAVARLQQLSHDDLVDFFARAKPEDVSEILEIFYNAEEARVITILADLSRRKTAELVSMVSEGDSDPLNALPEAAQKIARKAADLRWTDPKPLESVGRGYARRYEEGSIFWSSGFDVRTTTGRIDIYLIGAGCGVAIGNQETAQTSPYGIGGVRQEFQSGTVYSSKRGTYRVARREEHEQEGGSGGWLGFPVGETKDEGYRQLQDFEGGTIYSYFRGGRGRYSPEAVVIYVVRREVISVLPDNLRHLPHIPASKETEVVSSSGAQGIVQYFEFDEGGGSIFGTSVYASEHGTVVVASRIWDYYSRLGAEKSWLGFPLEQEQRLPSGARRGTILAPQPGWCQRFEGGAIYWRRESDAVSVPAKVMEIFESRSALGFPLSEEEPVGKDGSGRIQYFEKGVVTRRGGKREIWLRPVPMPEPKPIPEPPVVKADANGAAASNDEAGNGSSLLKRFGKKEEPQDVPVAPQTKVVRQQPVRQTRSKRGNTGKW